MTYLNQDHWHAVVEIPEEEWPADGITYAYFFRGPADGQINEHGHDRRAIGRKHSTEIYLIDVWNHEGAYENTFFTTPFSQVLLTDNLSRIKTRIPKHYTHTFRVKAPLLKKHEVLALTGDHPGAGDWSTTEPVLMNREGEWWTGYADLAGPARTMLYKYGIYHTQDRKITWFEQGDNRVMIAEGGKHRSTIVHDGFLHAPNDTWKGAGISIPVFSLRTMNSFGVGEFNDLRLLVDWAAKLDAKLIQILPVNDTIATSSWPDSYPYAAISAFALHPLYINLAQVAGKKHADKIKALRKKQKQLNELPAVDYEEVLRFKFAMLRELHEVMGKDTLEEAGYKHFMQANRHWLRPYAAFSYLRDKYRNSDYSTWKTHSVYQEKDVDRLFLNASSSAEVNFYCFLQYHLHLQLKEAADYAHKKGIVLKGDIPIGIYRYGCDAWVDPSLYNMEEQAGAPPDDFAVNGQNWEFPTYNWKKMQEDGFAWWRRRFEQMSTYFDAFRIDHILGFFRIWSIPAHAVQGIMGRFVPCIPVHYVEFAENGIWFDEQRFCKPFIIDEVISQVFPGLEDQVRSQYLVPNQQGGYDLRPEFDTQRKVEAYFSARDQSPENALINTGLYELISNVIFFKEERSQGQEFHFRISMENTTSFRYLIPHVQHILRGMYNNYFYSRQDEFWKKEAMNKLPHLKDVTNMLICGEDLGMVPRTVPDVMQQLGILSLEIQRMPKDTQVEFFHPDRAPYLSVVTPGTHDMSTVRGWWEEDHGRTQRFYNTMLGQWGGAPYFCEPWINRIIILQHLYSPAMWAIFQLQDLLGMSDTLRRANPQEERINDPANSKHYWRYRMHLNLEELLTEKAFNEELKGHIHNSGR